MIPVLTPAEMGAVDAAAPESVEVLIGRAGAAVARVALEMLGGGYGRRVVVVAGKGNNGADGRAAARRLRRRGVRVVVVDPGVPSLPSQVDLVIDAAFGTGFRGSYTPVPLPTGTRVLAVDIASGLDGITGERAGTPWRAERTVTFAALKPGLLFGDGPDWSGVVTLADIGLECEPARTHLAEDSDVARWVPRRSRTSHKWGASTWVIGGSAGMPGAAALAATGALRAGASYVRLSSPGAMVRAAPVEAVGVGMPMVGWDRVVLDDLDRVASVVVGPGLGRADATAAAVRSLVNTAPVPMVVDGDALWAIAPLAGRLAEAVRILTPHDGEFAQLTGHPVGADRLVAARRLAAERGAIVVLKGPTTVVAEPAGAARVVTSGDQRLATAGTGDVLAGIIGALLSRRVDPFDAATAAAHVHGAASRLGEREGFVASDLPALVSGALSRLVPA